MFLFIVIVFRYGWLNCVYYVLFLLLWNCSRFGCICLIIECIVLMLLFISSVIVVMNGGIVVMIVCVCVRFI